MHLTFLLQNGVIGFGVMRKLPFACLALESWGYFFFLMENGHEDFLCFSETDEKNLGKMQHYIRANYGGIEVLITL